MGIPVVIRTAEFVTAAVKPEQCPSDSLPEVAFAGRSNVGKSTLINCLLQRKKLVRISRTPGRTQTINFFCINSAFYFVDLPGYGYAKVPEAIRASWRPMVESYLGSRKHLSGIVQLFDLRHPPTVDDLKLWGWLQSVRIPTLPVLTKADKVRPSQRLLHTRRAADMLGIPPAQCVCFSALTGNGRDLVWETLLNWMGFSAAGKSPTAEPDT
jgi:GTP-binding protein